jgi:hypothetical protein
LSIIVKSFSIYGLKECAMQHWQSTNKRVVVLRRAARGQYQNRIKIEASKTHYRAHATSLIFCYIRSFFKVFGDIFLRCLAKNRWGVWRKIVEAFGEFSAHNLINETTFILFQYFKGRLGLLIEERWVQHKLQVNLQQHKQLNFNNYCAWNNTSRAQEILYLTTIIVIYVVN